MLLDCSLSIACRCRGQHQIVLCLCLRETVYFLHVKLSVQYITAGYPQPREKVFSISGNKSIRRSPISQQHATCIYCTVFSRVLKYWALHVAVQPYCFRFQGVNNVKKKAIYAHAIIAVLVLLLTVSQHSPSQSVLSPCLLPHKSFVMLFPSSVQTYFLC